MSYETTRIQGRKYVKVDSKTWVEVFNDETPKDAFIGFHEKHNRPYEGMNSVQRLNREKEKKHPIEMAAPEPIISINVEEAITSEEYDIIQSYLNEDV